jgi:ABC-type multidrug transport system permease subunit
MNGVEARQPRPTPSHAVSDALVMLRRELVATIRRPALLVVSFLQPVLLALLFRYVFGGAIEVSGIDYVDYLMPGLLVQTAIFGALVTGIGIAEDLQNGAADRFRSLPTARSAILIGGTLSDLVRNTASLAVLVGVGVAVGFRPDGSPTQLLAGLALVLAYSYVISWVAAAIGLWMREPETVHSAGFIWALPLTLLSRHSSPPRLCPPVSRRSQSRIP